MPTDPNRQVAIRLPKTLIKRLDAHAKRMREAHPGLKFTRSDAVRTLLSSGLDAAEGKAVRLSNEE